MHYTQWITFKSILLSGDVEENPGPDSGIFKFCTWNLNSIVAHDFFRVSLLEAYNSVYNYDLMEITVTHLDSNVDKNKLYIDGYTFFNNNHPLDIKRGGVGLYVKDSFPAIRRPELEILPECIICEIQLDRKKYFFVVVYRSPSQSHFEFENFMNTFEQMLTMLAAENPYSTIITGDFNCRSSQWWENDIDNYEGKLFEPFTSDLGLNQLITEPTHLMGESKSCIDLIFTDQPNLFLESGVHPTLHDQCHHQIIYGMLSIKNPAPPPYKRRLWYYDKANIAAIRKSIEMFHWREALENITCPSHQVEILNEVLLNIFSNFIPNEFVTVKPKDVPWITRSIKSMIQKKNRAYKTFMKNGQPDDKVEGIQDLINRTSKTIEDAKHKYFMKIGETLSNSDTGNKRYWSLINKILNKTKVPLIPPLLENDVFVLDFEAKAKIFNDYFILQCSTLDTGSEIPDEVISDVPPLVNIAISDEKLLKIIRSLNPKKAHGWDGISVRMIKICDSSLLVPLKMIFHSCMIHGSFPEAWKRANVVPIHKKNSKNLKQNYRPISLLPIFGKIFEKLIFDSLYQHLNVNGLLNPNQSGFRPGDSTINQLLSIVHTISAAFDCNPTLDVRSVFLDISKAFDRVWHKGLIYKLRRCGVSGNLLSLIQSFLANRKQRTLLNGKTSEWGNITAGVPQGSILGPIFFLVYINDLADNIKCKVKLFADDTSLFTVVCDTEQAALDMNHDLRIIQEWAYKWRMSFNPDPMKQAVEVIFSRKRTTVNHPPISFNDTQVVRVNEHKHLGIILDSKLTFSSHIQSIISKTRQGVGMLRFMSRYLPRKTLNELYKLYVRPHLDYGDVIYHIPSKKCDFTNSHTLNNFMEKLESVQYSAARAITGAWKGTSRKKLLEELGWETLDLRRWSRRLVLFYKIVNNITPAYTRDPIPLLHELPYSFRTRPATGQIYARTDKYESTFYPNCLAEWENIDPETRNASSLGIFKEKLNKIIRPTPKQVFGIHDPKGLAALTQLRVGLSALNFHKFRHNFNDTLNPMCPINDGVEDTEHFLLHCHSYHLQRNSLLSRVQAILLSYGLLNLSNEELVSLILYGDERLPIESNKAIIKATLEFIESSKRFS